MSKTLIFCPSVPTFDYEAGQTYFTELFHHTLLKNLEALSAEGASIAFSTEAEDVAMSADFVTWASSMADYIEGITSQGFTGTLSAVPSVPGPSDVDKYHGSGWKTLLLQVGLRLAWYFTQHYLEKWLSPDDPASVDFAELIAKLEQIRLGLAGEYDENLVEGVLQKLDDLKSEIDVMMSSFRLELDMGVS